MTRSEAALKRRAAKRNRTLEEQRVKDNSSLGNGAPSSKRKKTVAGTHVKDTSTRNVNRDVNGDHLRRKGGVASMRNKNDDGLDKRRYKVISKGGFKTMVPIRNGSTKQDFSKKTSMKWPEQAGPERIKYNQNLREKYKEDPSKLDPVELERALILIKRDERKKEKKLKQKMERDRKKEMKRTRKEKRKEAGNVKTGVATQR